MPGLLGGIREGFLEEALLNEKPLEEEQLPGNLRWGGGKVIAETEGHRDMSAVGLRDPGKFHMTAMWDERLRGKIVEGLAQTDDGVTP